MGYTMRSASTQLTKVEKKLNLSGSGLSDVLIEALKRIDIDIATEFYHEDYCYASFFPKVFRYLKMHQAWLYEFDACYSLERIMQEIHPYVVLRLLAENPENYTRKVNWGFTDVVDGGWVERDDILKSIGSVRKFLIVTEGNTDSEIIQHALGLLKPNIADFFSFVDMNEGYPFTGCGNLQRFCQGLAGIGVENNVIVLYDNDAAGFASHTNTLKLNLPSNMRAIRLPDCESFEHFDTIGPSGNSKVDINGRAAAIECYLDLEWNIDKLPVVRWTNIDRTAGQYQGRLVDKSVYTSEFLSLNSLEAGYDFSKIKLLLDLLISTAINIAEESTMDRLLVSVY